LTDPVSRRHFVKIMSASFLLAGFGLAGSGCRRPEQKILPFSKMPENYIHGVPQYYATAMPVRGSAIPLLVRSILIENEESAAVWLIVCWWHAPKPIKAVSNATGRRIIIEAPEKGAPLEG
jgi:hypothetical protein